MKDNCFASSAEVIVSTIGMKILCLVSLQTITNIEVNPEDGGSCSMKSIEMESHGRSGIGSCFRKP